MTCTVRTTKFMTNPLLKRKQMVVKIAHPDVQCITRDELRNKLAKMYKVKSDVVTVFGMQTCFGGGRTTGFAMIYDSVAALKDVEPKHRIFQSEGQKLTKSGRKQRKERKNRALRAFGTRKAAILKK